MNDSEFAFILFSLQLKHKKKMESDVARENEKNREKGLLFDNRSGDNKTAEGARASSPSTQRAARAQEVDEGIFRTSFAGGIVTLHKESWNQMSCIVLHWEGL